MLNPPAEVTSEKNKQGTTPLLLLSFIDKSFFVGSKQITVGNLFLDLMEKDTSLSLQDGISESLNTLWALSSLKITMLNRFTTHS